MSDIGYIIESAEWFYKDLEEYSNGRNHSWEYCYKAFSDARNNNDANYDYLSLQLAFYLASWGMYRGSSFLLKNDYKVHVPVVEEILDCKYNCLHGIDCKDFEENFAWNLIEELVEAIKQHYRGVRQRVIGEDVKSDISDILITKILLGTVGCVPAYDTYFCKGLKDQGIASTVFGKDSLLELVSIYKEYKDAFESIRNRYTFYGCKYPHMKILDMSFWTIGSRILGDA